MSEFFPRSSKVSGVKAEDVQALQLGKTVKDKVAAKSLTEPCLLHLLDCQPLTLVVERFHVGLLDSDLALALSQIFIRIHVKLQGFQFGVVVTTKHFSQLWELRSSGSICDTSQQVPLSLAGLGVDLSNLGRPWSIAPVFFCILFFFMTPPSDNALSCAEHAFG
jgi:hypothetical protein